MQLLPHQIAKTKVILRKLRLYGFCLLAGEVRSGKTACFVEAAKRLSKDDNYLIITKKNAISGIKEFTNNVTNYHQCSKINKQYDVVVIDECHRYVTGYPKTSTLWKSIYNITSKANYIIFSSGTPTPESYSMLFNMLKLTLDTPYIKYKNFYQWYNDYGTQELKVIGWNSNTSKPITAKDYSKVNEVRILRDIKPYKVAMSRKEAGHIFDAEDKIHLIPLNVFQQEVYQALAKDRLFQMDKDFDIVADTPAKYLQKLHQIAGGFCNAVDLFEKTKSFYIGTDKIQYIKDNFDTNNTIILAHYIEEQKELEKHFKHTGSTTKNSEGVDFSHFDNMVIFSFGFSAATYEQVRARQLNFIKRKTPVQVHFLLSGIDTEVYRAVTNKKNFTTSWYKNERE